MKWFRLYSEFAHDPKLKTFSKAQRYDLVCLMCLANDSRERGVILLDDEDIVMALEIDPDDFIALTDRLTRKGILCRRSDGFFAFTNWIDRQYDKRSDQPENVKERVARHRQHKTQDQAHVRLFTPADDETTGGNATVTPCNATVTPCNATVTPCNADVTPHTQIQNREYAEDKYRPKKGDTPAREGRPLKVAAESSAESSEVVPPLTSPYRPDEPPAVHQPTHLLWRIEALNGGPISRAAMGREAKAAQAMLQHYAEDVIVACYQRQRDNPRRTSAYSLHYLQDDIAALVARDRAQHGRGLAQTARDEVEALPPEYRALFDPPPPAPRPVMGMPLRHA